MIVKSSRYEFHLDDTPFAKGGEGAIHDVIGNNDLVAKIYHPAGRTQHKLRKIKAMLDNPPKKTSTGQTAWPVDCLYDKSGRFLGFLMPRIRKATKIDNLYSYDNRDKHPWGWYVRVAKNLCAAVDSVHKSGHCIGDLNPANICVEEATGLVTLVDTDSYHIRTPRGESFPCVVCMPAYIPGELHKLMSNSGFDLRHTTIPTFSIQTDYFVLAIHIFALLMNGCHPYACTVPGGVSASRFTLVKNITNAYFPFVKSADLVGVPKYAPYLGILPQRLKTLMIQVFTAGSTTPGLRPDCAAWHGALEDLEQQLVTCSANSSHQHLEKESDCPWCKIETGMRSAVAPKPQSFAQIARIVENRAPKGVPSPAASRQTPAGGQQGNRYRGRRQHHLAFWDSGFGTALSYFLTLLLWAVLNALAQWGLALLMPTTAWWAWLIRYALFGIVPFLPTWLFYFWGLSSLPLNRMADYLHEVLIGFGKWFALIGYGGTALAIYWESGVLNTMFGVLFVCLPILLVMKFLPSFAGEDI